MHEKIKFRGKTPDDIWVYGCYLFDNSYGDNRSVHLIFPFEKIAELSTILHTPAEGKIKRFTGECYEVIPETVGQFIGLKDKNGKDLNWWKGDLISSPSSRVIYEIFWHDFEGQWYARRINFNDGSHLPRPLFLYTDRRLEVIGNIIDDPKLLEQGK